MAGGWRAPTHTVYDQQARLAVVPGWLPVGHELDDFDPGWRAWLDDQWSAAGGRDRSAVPPVDLSWITVERVW